MLRKLDLIGVQSDWGASQRGASMGPAAIRFGGLVEGLERQGHHVRDRGDILAPRTGASREKLLHYEQVSEVNRRVYLSVTKTLEEGRFPVILGGRPQYRRRQHRGGLEEAQRQHRRHLDRCQRRLEQRGEHMHRQYARDALFRCLWLRT